MRARAGASRPSEAKREKTARAPPVATLPAVLTALVQEARRATKATPEAQRAEARPQRAAEAAVRRARAEPARTLKEAEPAAID